MDFDFSQVPHYWVNRLGFLIRKQLQDRFRAAGFDITPEEWAVLLHLWRQDGLTPGDLAASTVRDPTTMTRLLDAMVRKDLVARRPDIDDRRKSHICLTENARALQPALLAVAKRLIAHSLSGVAPADLDVTLGVLRQMTENMMQKGDVK